VSTVGSIVRLLADLAPTGRDDLAAMFDVTTGGRNFVWLGTDIEPSTLFGHRQGSAVPRAVRSGNSGDLADLLIGNLLGQPTPASIVPVASAHRGELRRLGALDALHREEHLLRAGWVWLSGRIEVDGAERSVLLPLLSTTVRVVDRISGTELHALGDTELTPLATGPDRARLESTAALGAGGLSGFRLTAQTLSKFPRLLEWIHLVSAACGFETVRVMPPSHSPHTTRRAGELVAVVGAAVYLARDVRGDDIATGLRNWAATPGLERTAFAQLLVPDQAVGGSAPGNNRPDPPLPLTAAQHNAVRRARRDPIVLVSGPPGSGKSHTVAAIALDAVAAGQSVLLATRSGHAADVLAELLARQPGPHPIQFGGSRRRSEVAAELAGGLQTGVPDDRVADDERAVATATQRCGWLHDTVRSMLALEAEAADAVTLDADSPLLHQAAPHAFDPDAGVDLHELGQLITRASAPRTSRWRRWRAQRVEQRVRALAGAASETPLDILDQAVALARGRRAAATLASQGGTLIGTTWDELARAEESLRLASGALASDQARAGRARDASARRAVQDLAVALRASRAVRRDHLRHIESDALLRALPLWVGTLHDIDDLLPAQPGLFDLVILDEASQIDLPRAATALLRARRSVVVGDPRQLRHVSFLAEAGVQAAVERHGLGPYSARLDVRRASAFDAAAGVAPVLWLDEHFRSAPHLIEFSSQRFYDGTIHVATRHPRNESTDEIDLIPVDAADGGAARTGVNEAEVDEAERQVRALVDHGFRSIGVVSPFRPQADALEAMLLQRFTLEQIEQYGLRVGTVHAFQGSERDAMVVSLALVDGDNASRRRFVEDPNLFNVMVTRARQHMVVLSSLTAPPPGLVADFLVYAGHGPAAPGCETSPDRWTAALADELSQAGLRCRTGYPVGRWRLDLVVGDGDDAVAVACRVHPQGPGVHIERHLQVTRAGWRTLEGWPSRFDHDPVRAAVALAAEARRVPGRR
jgi:hypothetical protein